MPQLTILGTRALEGWPPGWKEGHHALAYAEEDPAAVEQARAAFDWCRARGFHAFHESAPGATAERIETFDPTVTGEIILFPQVQGG